MISIICRWLPGTVSLMHSQQLRLEIKYMWPIHIWKDVYACKRRTPQLREAWNFDLEFISLEKNNINQPDDRPQCNKFVTRPTKIRIDMWHSIDLVEVRSYLVTTNSLIMCATKKREAAGFLCRRCITTFSTSVYDHQRLQEAFCWGQVDIDLKRNQLQTYKDWNSGQSIDDLRPFFAVIFMPPPYVKWEICERIKI